MIGNCAEYAAAVSELRGEIGCASVDERTVAIDTGRYFADGDGVTLLVRRSSDGVHAVISDGGLTSARKSLHSDGESAAGKALWADIRAEYGIEEAGDRLFLRVPFDRVSSGISLLSDACVALDVARLSAVSERRTFGEKLRLWLEQEVSAPLRSTRTVFDRYGETQKVTAIVESPRGEIILQSVGGATSSARKSNAEHAYWVMSDLDPEITERNRLVVFESIPSQVTGGFRSLVRKLSEHSYVGSFDRQLTLAGFLTATTVTAERDLVFESFGQMRTDE